eukprot:CAMPEP_0201507600 /NCGR_PEP_ID=MMETSP0161_2-20130828/1232_1 /ASSEMBLY_ACC=CAM_ASM_000251 /TAXON_ID=180227 /ORGANISM="Neoparamoeba aestuarina, Strain SoJaBio B1-5/56/2" /LENGTH=346 /DNA_ID=CAMNT_0047902021 /DNA_START=66 /DNA_END=1106 /DNA_ORIENTATION=-
MKLLVVFAVALVCSVSCLDLNCPDIPPPPPPATDVNHLHPSDFKYMFAAGDSVTAGFAMHGKPEEYRKDVYSIGANPDANTMFNYMKMFSPSVVGGSTENTWPTDVASPPEIWLTLQSDKTQLNGAISEAKVADVPPQVHYLAKQMKNYDNDWKNDWKLFTLFIGANDLCESCKNRSDETPEAYGQGVENVVEEIYKKIPRVAVQLVSLFNISQVWDINRKSPYCELVDKEADECSCLYDDQETRQTMDDNTVYYNQQLASIAQTWQAKNLQNFTVVYQPCFENTILHSLEYLSDLDCFHPSSLTDEMIANGLWNTMWTPAAQKSHGIEPGVEPICPTSDTIFYTT